MVALYENMSAIQEDRTKFGGGAVHSFYMRGVVVVIVVVESSAVSIYI